MSDEAVTHIAGSTFPQTPEEFDDDPRVSYSKLDQKWILENDDGNEFEFDSALKRWIPSVRVLTCSPGYGRSFRAWASAQREARGETLGKVAGSF